MKLRLGQISCISVLVQISVDDVMFVDRSEWNCEAINSTGLQDPHQLFFGRKGVGHMLQDVGSDDHIESVPGK